MLVALINGEFEKPNYLLTGEVLSGFYTTRRCTSMDVIQETKRLRDATTSELELLFQYQINFSIFFIEEIVEKNLDNCQLNGFTFY